MAHTFASPYLGCEPKVKVATLTPCIVSVSIVKVSEQNVVDMTDL